MESYLSVGIVVLLCLSGADAQLNSVTSCIGNDVNYTCTVDSTVHIWDFGDLTGTVALGAPLNEPAAVGVYSLIRVAGSSGNSSSAIVSILSVTAFDGLNGTQISCRDGMVPEVAAETQTTTAMVFGSPSSPTLVAIAVNLTTFNFTINPPDRAGQCVLNYTITSTDSDGTMENIIVEVDDVEAIIEHMQAGFILCNNTYNFTIVANTLSGPGERSEVVNPNKVDFLTPQLSVVNSDFSVTITGTVPTNFLTLMEGDVAVSIQRSSPTNADCRTNVATNPSNDGATVTVMDQLSCQYAGQRVTYCLQFTTDQCDSATVMDYTDELPTFVSSLSFSSTSDAVTLMVDVDNQHNCDGQNTLTITATISDGDDTVIFTQEDVNFADGSITFGSVPDGEFTCTVSIVDGMGFVVSQEEIPCRISPTSAPASIGGIVGGVVGGVAGVSVVVIVVVVILIVMKKKGKGDPEKNVTTTEMKPTGTYQPEADDHPDSSGPTATYADPRSIEHEAAGPTGDEYALVSKPSKKKNTNTDMLVYADLEVTNQSRRAAPVAPRGIGSAYPAANDNEPVMYSTVQ